MADYYTFLFDVRGDGKGSRVGYKPDAGIVSTPLEQGEMVGWDKDDNALKRWVRDGTGNIKFVGIAADSIKAVQKLGNQTALTPDRVSVFTTGVHALVGKAGDTYTHGDAVYMESTDTTKITLTAGGGTQIGIVWLPDGTSKAGAVRVPVLIDSYTVTQE